MYRRRAGIPDSDKRDFKIAYADAEARRIRQLKARANLRPSLPAKQDSISDMRYKAGNISTANSIHNLSYTRSPSPSQYSSRRQSFASPQQSRTVGQSPYQAFSPSRLNFESGQDKRPARKQSLAPSGPADNRVPRPTDSTQRQANARKRKTSLAPTDADTSISASQRPPQRKRPKTELQRAGSPDDNMSLDERPTSSIRRQSRTSIPGSLVLDDESSSDEAVPMNVDEKKTMDTNGKRQRSSEDDDGDQDAEERPAKKTARKDKGTEMEQQVAGPSRGTPTTRTNEKKKTSTKKMKQPGDTWQNLDGEHFRMARNGAIEKSVEVKELRPKYKMPKDSKHPDSKILEEVIVQKWIAEPAFDQLKRLGKLSWQTQDPNSSSTSMDVDEPRSSSPNRAAKEPHADEQDIYFAKGSRVPLYPTSPKPFDRSNGPFILPNGRIRLSSGPASRTVTPRRSVATLMQEHSSNKRKKKASTASVDSSFSATPDSSLIIHPTNDTSTVLERTDAPGVSNLQSPFTLPSVPVPQPHATSAPAVQFDSAKASPFAPKAQEPSQPASPAATLFNFGDANANLEAKTPSPSPFALAKPEPKPTEARPVDGQADKPLASMMFSAPPAAVIPTPQPTPAAMPSPFTFSTGTPSIPISESKPASFSFGKPPDSVSPFAAATKAAEPTFSFAPAAKPVEQQAAFSFAKPAEQAAQSPFSFGMPSAAPMATSNPVPASSPNPPAFGSFNPVPAPIFGSSAPAQFAFGSPGPTTAPNPFAASPGPIGSPSTSLFSMGATIPEPTTPGRKPIKGLPTRRR